jgi:hypothetical protein
MISEVFMASIYQNYCEHEKNLPQRFGRFTRFQPPDYKIVDFGMSSISLSMCIDVHLGSA